MWWGERDPGTRMTEHDRLLLLALTRLEADMCACGHPREESLNPKNDKHDPEGEAGYFAGEPFRCLACTELAVAQQAYAKAVGPDRTDAMHGLKWMVELIPRRKPAGVPV